MLPPPVEVPGPDVVPPLSDEPPLFVEPVPVPVPEPEVAPVPVSVPEPLAPEPLAEVPEPLPVVPVPPVVPPEPVVPPSEPAGTTWICALSDSVPPPSSVPVKETVCRPTRANDRPARATPLLLATAVVVWAEVPVTVTATLPPGSKVWAVKPTTTRGATTVRSAEIRVKAGG